MDDSLGTDVAVAACCHLAIPDRREGKPTVSPEPGTASTLHGLKFLFNYPKMH